MSLTGDRKQRSHKVMILGGGLVGSRVAQLLEKTVQVTLIEKDEKSAEELSFTLKNTEVLHGDGSDANVLQMAGLLDMDTFITATGENETNIMSSLLAKHLMNGKGSEENSRQRKSICLVNKEDYLVLAGSMGSDIALNKKMLAGNEILKFIEWASSCPWPICMVPMLKWWKSWPNPTRPLPVNPCPKWIPLIMERFSSALFFVMKNGRSPWVIPGSRIMSGPSSCACPCL